MALLRHEQGDGAVFLPTVKLEQFLLFPDPVSGIVVHAASTLRLDDGYISVAYEWIQTIVQQNHAWRTGAWPGFMQLLCGKIDNGRHYTDHAGP